MSSDPIALFGQVADGGIAAFADFDIRLVPGAHPWEVRHAGAITANWAEEIERNPRLYNGRMTMISALGLQGRTLRGVSHEIAFATFLYWRKAAMRAGSAHLFAFAVPVARDGRVVAVKMGRHTANPGLTYFAAGSFEPADFSGGQLDFVANTHREVREETGLDLSAHRHEAGFMLARSGDTFVAARRYFLGDDAEAIAARIRAHVAADAEPEIEGPVIIGAGERPASLTRHMHIVLDWHFGTQVPIQALAEVNPDPAAGA